MPDNGRRGRKLAGELIVPLIMVAFIGAYWWQAAGLSTSAISFPLALSGVLVVLLAVQLILSWRAIRKSASDKAASEEPDDSDFLQLFRPRHLVVPAQRLAMIGLGAGLFLFWRELGGTLVVFFFTLGMLVLLAERRWQVLIFMPIGLTIVLSYLFKAVLRVRFPDGVLTIF